MPRNRGSLYRKEKLGEEKRRPVPGRERFRMGIKWVGIGIGEKGWKEPQVQSYAGRTDQQPLGYVNRHLGHCPRFEN